MWKTYLPYTLSPRGASAVRGRYGSRSRVSQPICLSSVIRRPISIDWSAEKGIGGLPSTSRRAPLCSLLGARDASRNTPGDRRYLGEHSYKGLRFVDRPSPLHCLLPPNGGSSPLSCRQNRHPVHSWVRLWVLGQKGRKLYGLAYWNADGVRSRKLEVEQFLSEHSVDICLLKKMLFSSGRVLMFANYVCHRTDRPTWVRGTAILIRRSIGHYAVPVSGL
jgi:hypothetical protein